MKILELPLDERGSLREEKLCMASRADSLPESVIDRICRGSIFWDAAPCFVKEVPCS